MPYAFEFALALAISKRRLDIMSSNPLHIASDASPRHSSWS